MAPFLIFALARTGSTTLAHLVNCHPTIRCLNEPFSPGNRAQFAVRCVTLQQSYGLEVALQAVWGGYNGFKHVWNWSGWPFEDTETNHQLLLAGSPTVIVMTRKNALRRAISVQISEQMQVWTATDDEARQRIKTHLYGPLDIRRLREEVEAEGPALAEIRHILQTAGRPWLEVTYEDFFADELNMETRIERVQSLLTFIGVGPVEGAERLALMRKLFDPAFTGFQNAMSYERIPNIQEVEGELGSEQTGFVFERENPSSSSTPPPG